MKFFTKMVAQPRLLWLLPQLSRLLPAQTLHRFPPSNVVGAEAVSAVMAVVVVVEVGVVSLGPPKTRQVVIIITTKTETKILLHNRQTKTKTKTLQGTNPSLIKKAPELIQMFRIMPVLAIGKKAVLRLTAVTPSTAAGSTSSSPGSPER